VDEICDSVPDCCPAVKVKTAKNGAFLFLLNGAMNALGSLLSPPLFPLKLGRKSVF
jgi:hypothetical protein